MRKGPSVALLKAIAVTAELCGRVFSEQAALAFAEDLSMFPEDAALKALVRCRREVIGRLAVADVVARIEDGRPGAEEAWAVAMRSMDEAETVVMTNEISEAIGVVQPILNAGDEVGARMAFKETYLRIVGDARDAGLAARWFPSLGTDVQRRSAALQDAANRGLLPHQHVAGLLPPPEPDRTTLTDASKKGIAGVKAALVEIGIRQEARKAQSIRERASICLAEKERKRDIAERVAAYEEATD